MAKDDIYGNKRRYENLVSNLGLFLKKPKVKKGRGKRKYFIKCKENLKYFYKICNNFDMKDLSYSRRVRVIGVLLFITSIMNKDLKACTRDDINQIIAAMHKVNTTVSSKTSFIKNIKCIWRVLFPEKDHLGRDDETLCPYVVRHLSRKMDKSKETLRNEKYTIEEFQQIIKFFEKDPKIQAFITIMQETYARPQEILYLKIRDLKLFDNYGVAQVAEHGKEGCKLIQFENLSYPYLLKWLGEHPLANDPNAFLFINESNRGRFEQLTNNAINKKLRTACKLLGIDKDITCYTLKRMGITIDRMNGVPDKIIISKAGWTSAKQLSTYDLGTQSEALRMSLIRKGLVKPETLDERKFEPKQKECTFCNKLNSFTDTLCKGCHRPLDRKHMQEMEQSHHKLMNHELLSRIDKLESVLEEKLAKTQ